MEIRYDREALKYLQKLQKKLRDMIKNALVLAWDPEFTKLTPEERKRLEAAEQRIDNGEYVKDSDIAWD